MKVWQWVKCVWAKPDNRIPVYALLLVAAVFLLGLAFPVRAEEPRRHLDVMQTDELCALRANIAGAAAMFWNQGARDAAQLPIYWPNDATEFETKFVNESAQWAFTTLIPEYLEKNHASPNSKVDPAAVKNIAYRICMTENSRTIKKTSASGQPMYDSNEAAKKAAPRVSDPNTLAWSCVNDALAIANSRASGVPPSDLIVQARMMVNEYAMAEDRFALIVHMVEDAYRYQGDMLDWYQAQVIACRPN